MKNLNSFDCCSLKTNLLVDVCFDTIMAGLALPLIYAIDFLGGGDPREESVSFEEVVVTIRYFGTVFLVLTLISLVILMAGIVKNWTKLFFPYFGLTASLITVALFGSIYSLFSAEQRSYALLELMFALMEAKTFYAVASYYKQLKANQVDYDSAFDINIIGKHTGDERY